MRFLLLFVVAFSHVFQSDAQETTPTGRFSFGVSFSPDYNFRTLSNDGSYSGVLVTDSRNEREIYKIGYTTGLNIVYHVSNTIEFETGVLFSDKGFRNKKTELTYGSQWVNGSFTDIIPVGLPSHAQFAYDHYYIDVPLKVNFNFGKKRLRFCVSGGVAANVFLKEQVRLKLWYDDGNIERDSRDSQFDYNRFNVSPQVSAGINYRLSNRLYFKVEPTFRYGLLSIIDAPVTARLWNAGLNVGFYFKP